MAPPSEFDLRAALRDGEGDEPDVNQVMIAGATRRAQRRSRILSAAVVIVAVGGLSAGAAAFEGSGGSSGSNTGAAAHGVSGGGLGSEPIPAKVNALADLACPQTAPTYAPLSRRSAVGSADYGSTTQLFTRRVSSVVVCAYGPAVHAASAPYFGPARLELAGRQAKQVAHSLETAPTAAPSASCSSAPNTSSDQYALIPVDPAGNTGQPVTAQVPTSGCGTVVTNGTAVRYGWTPPPDVAAKLDELSPSQPPGSLAPAASMTASPRPSATS